MKDKKVINGYTNEYRKMIVELFINGHKISDISEEFGHSKETIYSWEEKFGSIVVDDNSPMASNDYEERQKQIKQAQEEYAQLKESLKNKNRY